MNFSKGTLVFFLTIFTSVVGIFQHGDVTFYLFTQENYIQINLDNATVDTNSSIVFLVHGWQESREVRWYQDLTNAFLNRPTKTVVIQVDWSKPASQFYPAAVYDTSQIGKLIAGFILKLVSNQVPIANIHVCGHSLGGQVAGFVGKTLQKQFLLLPRITALDPAGLLFEGFFISDRSRLTRYDAQVVVVIHTDSWKFGYLGSCGTVDIFPNGGASIQPGCPDLSGGRLLTCSHQRSNEFFIDALEHPGTLMATRCWNNEAFKAGKCDGKEEVDMGGEFSEEDDGDYYLVTRTKKPYGLGPRCTETNKNL